MRGWLNPWILLWIELWIQRAKYKVICGFSAAQRVGAPNLWVVQESTVYTRAYYSAIKKNEILPSVITWMDLESIMLSEVSLTEKDKYFSLSLICRT